MFVWEQKTPDFLFERRNTVTTIVFTALFALAFINLYAPFGIELWLEKNKVEFFFYSSLVILTGILVIVISRIIMFAINRRRALNWGQFGLGVFCELMGMAAFYAVFGKYIIQDERSFSDIFRYALKNTSLVILLPYTVLYLYFSWKEKSEQLEQLRVSMQPQNEKNKMILFHDEKGSMRISVQQSDLLFIESADNYVYVHYRGSNKISKYLLRNSLKRLEEQLLDYDIVRCHRKYLVSFKNVRILKKEKEGLYLEMNTDDDLKIPVSKTYVSSIVSSFAKYT